MVVSVLSRISFYPILANYGCFGHKKVLSFKAATKIAQFSLKTCYQMYLEGFRTKEKNVPFLTIKNVFLSYMFLMK